MSEGRDAGAAGSTRLLLETASEDGNGGGRIGFGAARRGSDGLRPGEVVGRYEVIEQIGVGGMGEVYAARDPELGRNVALKVVRSDRRSTGGARSQQARLLREARSIASLTHPNIVTVHDVGAYGHDGAVIAMELVAGIPLSLWWGARPRTSREIVTVVSKAGRGLAAAHASGLVHRDFKPHNILVSDDGRVRVLDFGLARAADTRAEDEPDTAAEPEPTAEADSDLALAVGVTAKTRTGAVLGTPGYVSLEQLRGEAASAASDQFSFCVTLYEGLYGVRPFPSQPLGDLVAALEDERIAAPPDGGRGGNAVPNWLRAVVTRGLAADPVDRWPSMDSLLEELAKDPDRRRRRRWLAAAVVAAVVVLGALASHWGLRARDRVAIAEQRQTEAEVARQEAREQLAIEARRARDGLRLALAQQQEDPTIRLGLLREVEAPETLPAWTRTAIEALREPVAVTILEGHAGAINDIDLAANGRFVTASADRTARVWDLETGESVVLDGHESGVARAEIDARGDFVATVTRGGTVRIWRADGSARPVTLPHDGRAYLARFSPDGSRVVTAARSGALAVWLVDGRVVSRHDGIGPSSAIAFSPDGSRVAAGSVSGEVLVWTPDAGGESVRWRGHEGEIRDLVFSPDGGRLATSAEDKTAKIWPATGGDSPVVLAGHDHVVMSVAFSHDGDRVVTGARDLTVRVWNADGSGDPVVLHGHTHNTYSVGFSPDGTRVVSASQDTTVRVWNADGSGAPLVLRGHDRFLAEAFFTPHGERLITASADGTVRVWEVDDGQQHTLELNARLIEVATGGSDPSVFIGTEHGMVWRWRPAVGGPASLVGRHGRPIKDVAISPDRRYVASIDSESGVRLWPMDGGSPRAFEKLDVVPTVTMFSPGSDLFAFGTMRGEVVYWPLDGRTEPVVLEGHDRAVTSIDFSPDGGSLVTGGFDGTARVWPIGRNGAPRVLRGHSDWIIHVAFSPDGSRVVTASRDRTMRVWRASGEGTPRVFAGHEGGLLHAVFSPDGSRVVTASNDGKVLLWDVVGDSDPIVLVEHATEARHAEFDASGTLVVTAGTETVGVARADGTGLPVLLPRYGELVDDPVFTDDGRYIVVPWSNGRLDVWATPTPLDSMAALQAELWTATRYCMSVERRRSLLGFLTATAARNLARCQEKVAEASR